MGPILAAWFQQIEAVFDAWSIATLGYLHRTGFLLQETDPSEGKGV